MVPICHFSTDSYWRVKERRDSKCIIGAKNRMEVLDILQEQNSCIVNILVICHPKIAIEIDDTLILETWESMSLNRTLEDDSVKVMI